MLKLLKEIKDKAKKDVKTIVLPESNDLRILKAAVKITKQKIAKVILIGKADDILKNVKKNKICLDNVIILNPKEYVDFDKYVKEYYELRKAKGMTLKKAKQVMVDPIYFGTMLVKNNVADGLVAGATHPTADTIRAAVQIIGTKKMFRKVSGLFLMGLHDRFLIFADSAVVIEPDAKDLADIALDTANTAKAFGIKPKIAMLSFSTAGSAKHPLVDKVKEATEIAKHLNPKLLIEGEMQVDAALVPEVCKIKFPKSKIMGKANVLIFPDLNSGNVAYKLVQRLAKARAVGPILQGLRKPINDLSRGCDVQDIVDLVAITTVQAQGDF